MTRRRDRNRESIIKEKKVTGQSMSVTFSLIQEI